MNIYPIEYTAGDRTPYTYFIKHKLSGKKYYGSRTAKGCQPNDLWTSYFTSSKYVHDIIKIDGAGMFDFRVARVFSSIDSCLDHEAKFLTRVLKNSQDWINRYIPRIGFHTAGHSISDNLKQIWSVQRLGRIIIHHPEKNIQKNIFPNELDNYLQKGFIRGILVTANILSGRESSRNKKIGQSLSVEHRQRVSASLLGKRKTNEHRENIRKSRLGTCLTEATKYKKSQAIKGRKWIHNKAARISKQINLSEWPYYENLGFEWGRYKI